MTVVEHFKNFDILLEESLSKHTSFRVGGPAEIFAMPKNIQEFTEIFILCKRLGIPSTILGDGSNVLVADVGLRGAVITTKKMNNIEILDNYCIKASAGVKLSKVAEIACKANLAGFEFASGIPGTVGGAIYMNAGAYDHDVGEFCKEVSLFSYKDENIIIKSGADMDFGYRKSYVQQGQPNDNLLVLDATFQLRQGEEQDIREKMKELNNRRKQSQPLDFPSAGSTFKRPPGFFAGKLIQDSGLKGMSIGGAQVSEKHAGFIINKGNASAQDIFDLIHNVRTQVHANFDIWLTPEVKILGFEIDS